MTRDARASAEGFSVFVTDGPEMTPDRIARVPQGGARFWARVGTKRGVENALLRARMYKQAGIPVLLDINGEGKPRFRADKAAVKVANGAEWTVGRGAHAALELTEDLPGLTLGQEAQVSDNGPRFRFVTYEGDLAVFRVIRPGTVNPGDGFVVPGVVLATSEDDIATTMKAANAMGIDAVAISFAEDPQMLGRIARLDLLPLHAKIESARGVANAEAIAREVETVVAAGGDLMTNLGFAQYAYAIHQIACAARRGGAVYCGATEIYHGALSGGLVTRSDARSLGFELLCGARGLYLTGTSTPHFESALGALVEQIGWSMGTAAASGASATGTVNLKLNNSHHQEAK